ncbi:hypothetical protein [Chroococcidiopsis sp. CCMEE 29]|uniref:DUF6887 family protein n=1 Tax=Chroococcidiopsis sp. CCMEE 29 TaxID=155894 RepID=UPI00202040EE|nr:hypothetical protein [Chroococcidiopsis sp. CCMEE 29]
MKPDFQAMGRAELRAYVLEHRDDREAFHAYIDKLATEPVLAVHSLSDTAPLAEVIAKVNREHKRSQS